MILVSGGIGLSLLHYMPDAKVHYRRILGKELEKNYYIGQRDFIEDIGPYKDEVILWDFHISEKREPVIPEEEQGKEDEVKLDGKAVIVSADLDKLPRGQRQTRGTRGPRGMRGALNNVIRIYPDTEQIVREAFYADEWAFKGYKVVNGFRAGHLLEENRDASLEAMASVGIPIPETLYAHSFDEAVNIVRSCEFGKMVVKISGDIAPWTTNICDNEDEAVEFLDANQDILKSVNNITIQKFIDGAEISSEVWIGKNGPIEETLNFSLETKKFLSGNLGLTTGCEYCLTWFTSKRNKITKHVMNFGNFLHKVGFVGCCDINFIVDVHGEVYGLEVTPRIGYDAHYVLFGIIDKYMGLERFMNGLYEDRFPTVPKDIYGFTMRISVPPYPIDVRESEEIFEHYFHDQTIKFDTAFAYGDTWFLPDGIDASSSEVTTVYVGTVNSISTIWREAVSNAYTFAKKGIKLLNKQYRNDGLQNLDERMQMLKHLKIM